MAKTDTFISTFHEWLDIYMHRSMRKFIHYARKSGLSMSMIGTLFHLHNGESAGVTDLGEHLGVTSAASSQMLERLVQQGLILRTEDTAVGPHTGQQVDPLKLEIQPLPGAHRVSELVLEEIDRRRQVDGPGA